MAAFLKAMLNVVEDVRVERLMGAAFSGAKENLRDVAVLLFGGDRWKEQLKALAGRPKRAAASLALSWALYRMRSMDVPELKPGLEVLSKVLDAVRPKTRAAMAMDALAAEHPATGEVRDICEVWFRTQLML